MRICTSVSLKGRGTQLALGPLAEEELMASERLTWSVLMTVFVLTGCGGGAPAAPNQTQDGGPAPDAPSTDSGTDGGSATVLPGPSHGSAVALSPDDGTAVVVNRDVGSVTVLRVQYGAGAPSMATVAELNLGAGSEPWQVVISPDGNRAFVILRQAQQLV